MTIWPYPKIWHLDHPQAARLWHGEVTIEEKIDGSQFSVMRTDHGLLYKSKGQEVFAESADKNFKPTIAYLQSIEHLLNVGYVYRGEALRSKKHNTLTYRTCPDSHFVVFDIETAQGVFLSRARKEEECAAVRLPCVPELQVKIGPTTIPNLLGKESFLGGVMIEGVVVKNYNERDSFGHTLMAKYVRPEFRELNTQTTKQGNYDDLIRTMGCSEVRWKKAIARLQEQGVLEASPRDISKLIKAIQDDAEAECWDMVLELFQAKYKKLLRLGSTRGFAEWYKAQLKASE